MPLALLLVVEAFGVLVAALDPLWPRDRGPRQSLAFGGGIVPLDARLFVSISSPLCTPHRIGDRPGPREHLRIVHGGFVVDRLGVHDRPALDNVQRVAVVRVPCASNHVRSLRSVTSTTSVLPSQRPTEFPLNSLMAAPGC